MGGTPTPSRLPHQCSLGAAACHLLRIYADGCSSDDVIVGRYSTTFAVSADRLARLQATGGTHLLVFDGVKMGSNVKVNGKVRGVARSEGVFSKERAQQRQQQRQRERKRERARERTQVRGGGGGGGGGQESETVGA